MSIIGFSHIALGVTDMDAVLPFYADVIGMKITSDFLQEMKPEQGPELHGGRHIRRRQVWLRSSADPHAAALALDQMLEPAPADRRAAIYDLGTHHFAFWVDDIETVIVRARAGGHPVIMPHTTSAEEYGDAPGSRIASVFLRDPDGNLVQCDQRIGNDDLKGWRASAGSIVSE
jgi:catechol 2,3-dioxygenase-like lactoylglutathione lyase family enzyme